MLKRSARASFFVYDADALNEQQTFYVIEEERAVLLFEKQW
jgi:hypothetical protein